MGKSKNRNRKKAPCPTGLPSVRDVEKEEEEFGCERSFDVDHVAGDHNGGIKPVIRSVVEKLQSVGVEEKECACCTVASLAERKEALPLLLEYNVIKALAPLMTISSAPVRHSCVGALRNLSACGDHDFCEAMVEQDVMTPLVALYKKQYGPGWQPQHSVTGKIDSVKETFVEATYLLCNLCESSSKAIHVFNKESLVGHLLPALNVETYGHHVAIAVARCLHTVSEDNGEILPVLHETANAEILSKLLYLSNNAAGNSLLRALSAGIILNVSCAKLSGCSSSLVEGIMKCLADVLTVDAVSIAIAMAKSIKDSKEPGEAADQGNDSNESMEWLLSAQQIALEVLINICCDSEDVDNWDDLSNSDDSEDMSCMDVSMEEEGEVADVKFPLGFSAEIHEQFISHDFLPKVLSKLSFCEETASQVLHKTNEGKKIYEKLFAIKNRALLCINNLVTCLDAHDLGGPTKLYELWMNLGQLAFQQTDLHPDILEASTSAMSSIIKKLTEIKSNQFAQFPLHDLQKMCELLQQISDPCIKVNLIRIFGSLGCLVGNSADENCLLLLKCIGSCLLSICNKDCDLWVESEALDAIFDVFAEDCHDSLLADIGAIEKLKGILPMFKHKIKQHGRKSTHLPIIMTARNNLARFIKYKTDLQSTNGNCHN